MRIDYRQSFTQEIQAGKYGYTATAGFFCKEQSRTAMNSESAVHHWPRHLTWCNSRHKARPEGLLRSPPGASACYYQTTFHRKGVRVI
jgi:hypothetical protein